MRTKREKQQGRRTDRENKPWGTTRKVSREARVSVPTELIGKSFEVIATPHAAAMNLSGSIVVQDQCLQGWEELYNLSKEKIKEIKSSKKTSSSIKP